MVVDMLSGGEEADLEAGPGVPAFIPHPQYIPTPKKTLWLKNKTCWIKSSGLMIN
jgi:hypothetical protein